MRSIVTLLLLPAVVLAEDGIVKIPRDDIPFIHFAYDGYEEPEYFRFIEVMLGSDYMKRCVKRQSPPEEGSFCRRDPKVCLFGEQVCIGRTEPQPTTRCNCHNRRWSCKDYLCPTIGDQCPSQDPETIYPGPICRTDLICPYGQQRCCDTVVPPKWCTCEAGKPFECDTFFSCTINNDCAFTAALARNILQAGSSRFPADFHDTILSAGGGGGPGGGGNGAMCDIGTQDCPDNFKCTVENIFVGAPRCRPLDDNPDQVGDECSKLGDNDGDTCDQDGICLGETCRGLDLDNNGCGPKFSHSYPSVKICEEECDPLLAASCNSVSGSSHCTRTIGSADGIFSCFIKENINLGTFGEGCVDDVQCQQGSICLPANVVNGFCDGGLTNCCVPLCDLGENPTFCGSLDNQLSCQSIFNGSAPPGLEHVGACLFS